MPALQALEVKKLYITQTVHSAKVINLPQPVAPRRVDIEFKPCNHTHDIEVAGKGENEIAVGLRREIWKDNVLCLTLSLTTCHQLEVYAIVAAEQKA